MKYADAVASLWPRAHYAQSLMVANAQQRARSSYGVDPATGEVLDIGALKPDATGEALVLMPGGTPEAPNWIPYNSRRHAITALTHARIGPGHSMGFNNLHNSAEAWFLRVYGRLPVPIEYVDLQVDGVWFAELRSKQSQGVTESRPVPTVKQATSTRVITGVPAPSPAPQPTPTPKPPPDPAPAPPPPPPAPVITPPAPAPAPISPPGTLTPASVRCEELRGLLRAIPGLPGWLEWLLGDGWPSGKAILLPALRGWRLWQRSLGDTRKIPPEDLA